MVRPTLAQRRRLRAGGADGWRHDTGTLVRSRRSAQAAGDDSATQGGDGEGDKGVLGEAAHSHTLPQKR
ncbi:hypothetical protein GCM10009841_33320 [Microlunatus panaciterrae]